MSQLQPVRAGHCLPLHLASLFCFELWVLYRSLNLACLGRLQKIPAPGVSPKDSDGLRHSRSHRHHRLQAKEWDGNQGNGIPLPSFSATRVIENQQIHNKSTRLIRSLFSNNVNHDTCFKTMLILSDWFSFNAFNYSHPIRQRVMSCPACWLVDSFNPVNDDSIGRHHGYPVRIHEKEARAANAARKTRANACVTPVDCCFEGVFSWILQFAVFQHVSPSLNGNLVAACLLCSWGEWSPPKKWYIYISRSTWIKVKGFLRTHSAQSMKNLHEFAAISLCGFPW